MCRSTSGFRIYEALQEVMRALHMIGLTTVALLCDGAIENRALQKSLTGFAGLDPGEMPVHFINRFSGQKVFLMSDVSHLIKVETPVKNLLAESLGVINGKIQTDDCINVMQKLRNALMASFRIKERQMVWTCHKLSWHPVEAVFIRDNNLQLAGEHYLTREAVYLDSFAKMKVHLLGQRRVYFQGSLVCARARMASLLLLILT